MIHHHHRLPLVWPANLAELAHIPGPARLDCLNAARYLSGTGSPIEPFRSGAAQGAAGVPVPRTMAGLISGAFLPSGWPEPGWPDCQFRRESGPLYRRNGSRLGGCGTGRRTRRGGQTRGAKTSEAAQLSGITETVPQQKEEARQNTSEGIARRWWTKRAGPGKVQTAHRDRQPPAREPAKTRPASATRSASSRQVRPGQLGHSAL